jgi:hypothetical protein
LISRRAAGRNHVAFYEGEDATHYHCRGGNQSDTINVTRVAKARLRPNGIRWPAGAPLPESGPLLRKAEGTVSTNEA